MQQFEIDFTTGVDKTLNGFEWLKQRTFVESAQYQYRLDDVARDVFHQSLRQEDEATFQQAHEVLAQHFKAESDAQAPKNSTPSELYKNPTWRELRSDYLYHLLFGHSEKLEKPFLTHLLETSYLWQQSLVQSPILTLMAEGGMDDTSCLISYPTRQFLKTILPVIDQGRSLFETDSTEHTGESKQAIRYCLQNPEDFTGLARFAARLFKVRHVPQPQQMDCWRRAYAEAESLVNTAYPDFGNDLFTFGLGNTAYALTWYEAAIAAYDQALEIKPDDHNALTNKGVALVNLGRYEAAIAAYDQALAIKPDKHEALNNKGVALVNLGRDEEAIAAYDQALEIKPDDHNALYSKGFALGNLGRYEEAIAAYDQALAIKPDKHEALYNKACCYALQSDADAAITWLQKAIDLSPDRYREMAKTDSDFDTIRSDSRFQALLN